MRENAVRYLAARHDCKRNLPPCNRLVWVRLDCDTMERHAPRNTPIVRTAT